MPAVKSPAKLATPKAASELDALQKSYDDYVESSKEFEGELEHALKEAEDKLLEVTAKKQQSEAKLATSQAKSAQLSKEILSVQNDLKKARDRVGLMDESTKKLETANDSLLEKVRILESTEADLTHKLENAEEDIVFLQSDLSDAKEQRSQTELRLREEINSLQTELSLMSVGKSSGDYKSHNTTPTSSPNPKTPKTPEIMETPKSEGGGERSSPVNPVHFTQERDSDVEDFASKLSESEAQNNDLRNEIGRLTEQVLSLNHLPAVLKTHKMRELKLEALVRGLNTQLFEAKGFLVELEESNTLLEETNTELYVANSDLDALNVDLEEENSTLKNENVGLREENSLLEDKFLISKQFALESNEELQEAKRDLAEKNRQLAALQNNMEEHSSEKAEKDLEIIKLQADFAAVLLQLETVKVQLSVQHASSADIVRAVHTPPSRREETEGVIIRLQQTINDLTERSEFFFTDKKEEENDDVAAERGHGQLITELRNSVDSLQETLEGFEFNLQHAAAQLKVGRDALNDAEFERAQLNCSVQRLGERLHAREVKVKSAQKDKEKEKKMDGEIAFGISILDADSFPERSLTYSNPSTPTTAKTNTYVLDQANDWEAERIQLLARCKAYRQEIDDTRAQAAIQQRQALLADFPTSTSTSPRSATRRSAIPKPTTLFVPIAIGAASDSNVKESQKENEEEKEKGEEVEKEKEGREKGKNEGKGKGKDKAKKRENENVSPEMVIVEEKSEIVLCGNTSVRTAAEKAMTSSDVEALRTELAMQLDRYESVRSTNAKLLQKLQAVKGNIQVCCRTRPPTDNELAAAQLNNLTGTNSYVGKVCVDVSNENEISCYDKRAELWKSFSFDRVWPFDTTQAEVFSDVEPLVLSVTEGFNTCLFAYGQTGSGKTFTMNGYGREYGVSYRTLQRIFETLDLKKSIAFATAERVEKAGGKLNRFNSLSSLSSTVNTNFSSTASGKNVGGEIEGSTSKDTDSNRDVEEEFPVYAYTVTVSLMEIYNEQVYDLLSQSGGGNSGTGLDIRQAPDGSVSVPGLHKVVVQNLDDVMEVFSKGSASRATTSTNLNEHSSRSHLIMLIDVDTVQGDAQPVRSKLFLVDLAGSERVGKSGVTGVALKEAQYINKSLSALGDVMEALDQKAKFVPYRNSKLTYLLQDALGGNSRTMMVVTVCPTDLTSDETLFTLQFATRVRNITIGAAKKNTANGKNLEEAVKVLKIELRESKRKRQSLEENIGELRKDQKKSSEKNATVMDVKVRSAEEKKAKLEQLYEGLQKSHQELVNKLQEERESKIKAQELLKDAVKETEREKAERLRERVEREKQRVVEKEEAARHAKIFIEKERAERMKDQNRVASSQSKDRLSQSFSRPSTAADLDIESINTDTSPPTDSPRSTSMVQTDSVGNVRTPSGALVRTNSFSKSLLKTPSSSVHKSINQSLSRSLSKPLNRPMKIPSLNSSSQRNRNSVRKDNDWSLEGQYSTVGTGNDEMDSNPDVAQLGPSLTPSIRSNIAARSREALLSHQLRMEKRRLEKLSKLASVV